VRGVERGGGAVSCTGVRCHGWDSPCESMNATRRRQDTAFVDDAQNWVTLCDHCMAANKAHWDEMWQEVYYGMM